MLIQPENVKTSRVEMFSVWEGAQTFVMQGDKEVLLETSNDSMGEIQEGTGVVLFNWDPEASPDLVREYVRTVYYPDSVVMRLMDRL